MTCCDIKTEARKFLALPPPGNYMNEKGALIKYEPTSDELYYYKKCKDEFLGA